VNFVTVILCVASQCVFIFVNVYFFIGSIRKGYISSNERNTLSWMVCMD